MHYYYSTPWRPYLQFTGGTFTGIGGGMMYYFTSNSCVGLGVDFGVNWIAMDKDGAEIAFAAIAPKAVVCFTF
jgi:hypothetical protein